LASSFGISHYHFILRGIRDDVNKNKTVVEQSADRQTDRQTTVRGQVGGDQVGADVSGC